MTVPPCPSPGDGPSDAPAMTVPCALGPGDGPAGISMEHIPPVTPAPLPGDADLVTRGDMARVRGPLGPGETVDDRPLVPMTITPAPGPGDGIGSVNRMVVFPAATPGGRARSV